MQHAEAVILGNCKVTTMEIAVNWALVFLGQISCVAAFLMLYSLSINGLQLYHTCCMTLSEHDLQYDKTSAVIKIIK